MHESSYFVNFLSVFQLKVSLVLYIMQTNIKKYTKSFRQELLVCPWVEVLHVKICEH